VGNERLLSLTGVILVLAGIVWFIAGWGLLPNWGAVIPFFVGLVFLAYYLFGSQNWAIIPGMIVAWVGVAVYLAASGWVPMGLFWPIFVLAPGIAFLSIFVVSPSHNRWAVYPGTIISLTGFAMFGLSLGTYFVDLGWLFAQWWPLVLILIGVLVLLRPEQRN